MYSGRASASAWMVRTREGWHGLPPRLLLLCFTFSSPLDYVKNPLNYQPFVFLLCFPTTAPCSRLDTQNEFLSQKLIEHKSITFRKPKLGGRKGRLQHALSIQITFQSCYLQFTQELTCETAGFATTICFNFSKRFCK